MKYFVITIAFFILPGAGFPEDSRVDAFFARVTSIARESIGMKSIPAVNGRHFTSDCIGFVDFVYYRAGFDLYKAYGKGKGGVDSLYFGLEKYGFVYREKHAGPGDIVFFDNTYDVRGRKRWDNPLSHIGIVVGAGRFDSLDFIHFANRGVEESRLNLYYPDTYAIKLSDGNLYTINSFLRVDRGEGFAKKEYVCANFYRAFAHIRLKPAD
jgi:hypothetical protein